MPRHVFVRVRKSDGERIELDRFDTRSEALDAAIDRNQWLARAAGSHMYEFVVDEVES